jgi:hypothetical protein
MDNLRVYMVTIALRKKDTQPSQTCSNGYTFSFKKKKIVLVWYKKKKEKHQTQ